ncbi:hypothetical protein N9P58_03880 [Puniceicoccaceae bacterium]|jgi:hypothetical protein|nr:hypothetical protein [Puniceicoccaceae bacterium]
MPIAYIDQLQCLTDATGNSKSEVMRMGLDALQATQKAQGEQTATI